MMKHQKNGALCCCICNHPYDSQLLAKRLPVDLFKLIEAANLDAKVDVLQQEFERKLQKEVDKIIQSCREESGANRLLVEREAAIIRDTVLNLRCPNPDCGAVYDEFYGCLAVLCESCKKYFCGLCHDKFDSSKGAHDHALTCNIRLNRKNSYWANAEDIAAARQRLRTEGVQKALNKFKKDMSNAIVVELTQDFVDLNLEPNNFFKVPQLSPGI